MHARYRIENTIDQGGMGTIYRAYDRLTNTYVALKQLTLELEETPDFSAPLDASFRVALAEEFRLLATLRHPHIVSVLDYGFVQDSAFFTMELLARAQPLVLAAQGQPFALQMLLLSQLLQALEYMRRHQVVHRDLKPDNVLVQQGQVKVLDFGLAVLEGQHSTSMGSLFYMAPESFGDQPLTHGADLFAVGVMAYEILTGTQPFVANSLPELVAAICFVEPDYARLQGPPALQAVVGRLLAKDPAARYATAAEALLALREASGEPLPIETEEVRASLIQAATFVGRDTERALLTAALNQAVQGAGSAWLIGGESGVGKSRLVEELRIQALIQRTLVWHGQTVSDGGQPGHVWQGVFKWLALTAHPTDLEAGVIQPLVPQLGDLLERLIPPAPELDAAAAQSRLCATTLTLLRRATAQQPVMLLLEDLHWADPLSLSLLAWVTRNLAELRVLVISTYRHGERPNLHQELPHTTPVLLQPLPAEQVAQLASGILGQAPTTLTNLTDYLVEQTEGNAFFVVEVLRALAEEAGLLSRVTQMALPKQVAAGGIQQIVRRRLERLAAAERAPLEMAAILGRQLDLPVMRYLHPDLNFEKWLTRCAEVAVLDPLGAGWQFAHDQLRQGVLTALAAPQQQALHARVALAIEYVYAADLTPHLSRLVHHYALTDQVEKHCHYLRLAGQVALTQYANAEAARYFSQALALTSPAALAERYALHLAREQAYDVQGLRTEQIQDLQALTQLARQLADPARQIEVALRYSAYYRITSNYPAAIAAAQQAFALAQTQGDVVGQATAQFRWGGALAQQGQYVQGQHQLEIALQLVRTTQAPLIEVDILRQLGIAHWRQNVLGTAQTTVEQGLQLARSIGDRRREGEALGTLAFIMASAGAPSAGVRYHQLSLQLAQATGNRPSEAFNLNSLGYRLLLLGSYTQARLYLEQALALAKEIDYAATTAHCLHNLGHLNFHQGQYAQAQSYHAASLQLWQQAGNQSEQGYCLTSLGYVTLAQARVAEAVELFEQAQTLWLRLKQPMLLAESQAGLAWAQTCRGQATLALTTLAPVLTCLATENLDVAEDPMLLCWSAYRVLRTTHHPRASEVLTRARTWLSAKAEQLEAPLRYNFIHTVPWHRELLANPLPA